MENNFKMIAKCLYEFEDELAKELRQLGAMDIQKGVRHVSFVGDLGFMYKANLSLRTAISILKPLFSFKIYNEDDFYKKINAFAWENLIDKNGTFAVESTVNSEIFTHSRYVVFRTKDAIVDRFRDKFEFRPSIDTERPDVQVSVHIDRENCEISLNTSGDPLFKRGYKTATNIAPINEVLAAGLLLKSGWAGQCDFLDPMCGSGTLLIEAAMIACNIPPNINRDHFAFQKWEDFDENLFEIIKDSTLKKVKSFSFNILGYDKAPSAVEKSIQNIENANLSDFIEVRRQDFFESHKTSERHLHMVFNPPYGVRLDVDVPKFYSKIGDTLKQNYPGSSAWFIVADLEAIKHVGLRPSRKIKLYNAKLESRLLNYQIYEGSKKASKQ
ncbi:THUMP domain-containing class I SAM-dependent RNA methyltransferase [Psychroflexus tropicus]|uniref:THUMP domain-containing class I SAM-dependent RNA methyltransferase n=1 Tax=Psychroflexus tropicus TaxID=197345 RepID=UPI00036DBDD6|nr:THUMP domain-containing protein [Psychroflexus tropicus]